MKKNLIWGNVFIILCVFIINIFCTGNTNSAESTKKILLLGFDGMDPVLLDKYMKGDMLPNFKLLKEKGDFKPLVTSMPPQSPVAWSNFITGMNPGGHGIFDFIARDPPKHIYLISLPQRQQKRKKTIENR